MSYSPMRNEDTLSETFSAMADANVFCKKMMGHMDDPVDFLMWFEKAKLADPRFVYLYLNEHKEELPEDIWKLVASFMARFDGVRAHSGSNPL